MVEYRIVLHGRNRSCLEHVLISRLKRKQRIISSPSQYFHRLCKICFHPLPNRLDIRMRYHMPYIYIHKLAFYFSSNLLSQKGFPSYLEGRWYLIRQEGQAVPLLDNSLAPLANQSKNLLTHLFFTGFFWELVFFISLFFPATYHYKRFFTMIKFNRFIFEMV